MTLEEMLVQSIPNMGDGKYINIHKRTHDNDLLKVYVHMTCSHLMLQGYTFETAFELGMLWVLDAITVYGMPDNDLREPTPTREELEQMRKDDLDENETPAGGNEDAPPSGRPEAANAEERSDFEKLLGDVDIDLPETDEDGREYA